MERINFKDAAQRLNLEALFQKISRLRFGVLGDLCLDIYWNADMRRSELSRETPHFPLPIVSERFSLGGAANVCANAAALGVSKVHAVGVIGDDWRGDILKSCCQAQGIDTASIVQEKDRFTNAYCKPIRTGIPPVSYEDPRLDFSTLAPIRAQTEAGLLEALDRLQIDVLCVTDQLKFGCVTQELRKKVEALARAGIPVLVDSRDRIGAYSGVYIKPNEVEGYAAVKGALPPENTPLETYLACAGKLHRRTGQKVFMTLGALGCVCVGGAETILVEAAKNPEQIDFVGAGDTMLAALCAALATGAEPVDAMVFANLCASVTIGKIGTTGTASPDEIRRALAAQTPERQ